MTTSFYVLRDYLGYVKSKGAQNVSVRLIYAVITEVEICAAALLSILHWSAKALLV